MKEYFKALREGLSKKEAHDQHLLPVLDALKKEYRAHVNRLLGV